MGKRKVSVAVITFNHERHIEEAISSACNQAFDGDYEVVIGDDCSTDSTSAICANFARKQPDRVRHIRRPHNIGMSENVRETLKACEGEYIALLEGDDYWASRDKLQVQAGFLNAHPEYSLVAAHAIVVAENGDRIDERSLGIFDRSDAFDRDWLTTEWPRIRPATCTLMFRRAAVMDLLTGSLCQGDVFDVTILFVAAKAGRIKYLSHTLGAYRCHSQGVWSGASSVQRTEMVIGRVAWLIRNEVYPDHAVRQWLQRLLDYNIVMLATEHNDSELFWTAVERCVNDDFRKLSENEWLVRTSAEEIVTRNRTIGNLAESTSFRVGNSMVEAVHSLSLGMLRPKP